MSDVTESMETLIAENAELKKKLQEKEVDTERVLTEYAVLYYLAGNSDCNPDDVRHFLGMFTDKELERLADRDHEGIAVVLTHGSLDGLDDYDLPEFVVEKLNDYLGP